MTRERIACRVIMDDIWYVADHKVLLQDLSIRAKILGLPTGS
jgi:hypothetical protein